MGLLLDLAPDGGMNDEGNDEELEAELLRLVGGGEGGGGGGRSQGRKGEGKGEKVITFHHNAHSFPPPVSSICLCLNFDAIGFSVINDVFVHVKLLFPWVK